MRWLILFIFLLSCGKSDVQIPESTKPRPNPGTAPVEVKLKIEKPKWGKFNWNAKWSQSVLGELKKEQYLFSTFVPDDGDLNRLNCPNYPKLNQNEREQFWLLFLASISAFESSFNQELRFYERSLKKYSEGLMQLSVDDSKYYPNCRGINKYSILVGESNLKCAVNILNRQLELRGVLFPRNYFYWSVLTRPQNQLKVIKFFNNHINQIPSCS